MSDHLKKTEKKLVTLFLAGIVLFLLIFEGIFLGSRYFLEKRAREEAFWIDTERVLGNVGKAPKGLHTIGVGIVIIGRDGNILFSQMPGVSSTGHISEFMEMEILEKLSDSIAYLDGNMVRRVDRGSHTALLFGAKYNGYEMLTRDMWRFLFFDMLLLIPMWFLIQMYIRRVFRPIRENIDTMTHFVHDA